MSCKSISPMVMGMGWDKARNGDGDGKERKKDQTHSDAVLDDVSCILGCTRSSLNVVAAEKGVGVGRVGDMSSDALFILLVEKDATYMRLAEDRFYNRFPCIIVTAKGQPDVVTMLFLRKMKMELKLSVLALVDSDPYGLKILSVYGCGLKNMSLPMTERDIKIGMDLLEEEFVKKNPGWVEELNLMVKNRQKAKIQALSTFSFQYVFEVYLPLKLQQQDWI
ncbi:DNA topoisomerase 6 subunit A [Tanacetum coccineum]